MEELPAALEAPIAKTLPTEDFKYTYMAPRVRPNVGLRTKSLFSGRKPSKVPLNVR